jgi:hypothetical protein
MSVRTHGRVCVDALCFAPGNFEKDATVRPSHGRTRGHRPIVRPSENVRVTTLLPGLFHSLVMKLLLSTMDPGFPSIAMWFKIGPEFQSF